MANLAHSKVHKAIASGQLIRPSICELCDKDVTKETTQIWHTGTRHKRLVAHHWRGYDYPFDVWWICSSCNRRLIGRHDGSLTKEQARWWIKSQGRFTNKQDYEADRQSRITNQLVVQQGIVQRKHKALLRAKKHLAEMERLVGQCQC